LKNTDLSRVQRTERSPKLRRLTCILSLPLCLVVLPLFPNVDYLLSLMIFIGLYGIAALGLSLLMGYAGQISLGQGVFYGIGAYSVGVLWTHFGISPWFGIICGVILNSSIAYGLGKPILRLQGHSLAVATFALNIIFVVLLRETPKLTGGPSGLGPIPHLSVGSFVLTSDVHYYYLVWITVAIFFIFYRNLVSSKFGRALRSFHSFSGGNEIASATLAIDVAKYKSYVFILSAISAGVAGSLCATYVAYISPSLFDFWFSLLLLIMVMTGGIGSLWGALLGAGIILALREVLTELLPIVISGPAAPYEVVAFGVIFLAILMLMPGGVVKMLMRFFKLGSHIRRNDPSTSPGSLHSLWQAGLDNPVEDALTKKFLPGQQESVSPIALIASKVSKNFGGLMAVCSLSMEIRKGEIVAIIGPNGAGKTTLFNLINGVLKPSSGEINYKGQSTTPLSCHEIAFRGLARTFQDLRIFTNMSVIENVMVGCHKWDKASLFAVGFRLPSARDEERIVFRKSLKKLAFVGLESVADKMPSSLPLKSQKLLLIARALALEPEILLLDEPASGLSPTEVNELADMIFNIRQLGTAILLIEHRMELVMKCADRVIVLNFGEKIVEGQPEDIRRDARVIEAYLGRQTDVSENQETS